LILWSYPFWLALISIVVASAERIRPWRPDQRALRRTLLSDFGHLIVNGHFLGVVIYGVFREWIEPRIPELHGPAAGWPMFLQIIVALVAIDFGQWCVHNLLHRVAPLWEIHKIHHSVVDGEMDWIVSFRFHWLEAVIYKTLLYIPIALLGFGPEAVLVHAVFGTLIGHLNHSNLDLGHGKWRYVLNNPRMHIWHHDFDGAPKNFGIIFSAWDWLFGTASVPSERPRAIGFPGVEKVPQFFLAHAAWPIARPAPAFFGVAVMVGLYALSLGPHPFFLPPSESSSQPTAARVREAIHAPDEARAKLPLVGSAAREAGWAHPESMVDAGELAGVLGLPELVLLDVRPKSRFEQGHIPTAQVVERGDYAVPSGLSKSGAELEAMLRARGGRGTSLIVIYGDGGAEPYRLWWTLREVLGLDTRVLDGGIQAWKQLDLPAPAGPAGAVTATGDLALGVDRRPRGELWSTVTEFIAHAGPRTHLVDTRTIEEFEGKRRDDKAARAGRIPGAEHLSWGELLVSLDDPRLKPRDALIARLAEANITLDDTVVSYCQSATRSSVTFYALRQLGMKDEQLMNYGGSWAEYSKTDLPIETTPQYRTK